MSKRFVLNISVLVGLILACDSFAAVIAPDLQEILAAKSSDEFINVLMLMDDHADLSLAQARLGKIATLQARRAAVVATLKSHAADRHATPLAILQDAAREDQAREIRSLWLANAVVFRGTASVVQALADTDLAATLVHDRPFDMISSVMSSQQAGTPPTGSMGQMLTSPATDDTVWSVKWINANRVWLDAGLDGSGILVAHFDTGVWLEHPDLTSRLWVNSGEIPDNLVDDDGNGYVDDIHGYDFADQDSDPNDDVVGNGYNHGTHTAGTVCGDGTNGSITGVAPGASLLVCKSMYSDGSGAPFSAIYEGQEYALLMGARIFTMSLGISGDIIPAYMRTERNVANALREAGVIYFNSAGNEHWSENPPHEIGLTARVPAPWVAPTAEVDPVPYSSRGGVVAVGGTGYRNDTVYSSSSQGPVRWGDVTPWNDWPYNPGPGLIKPDLAAPGTNINSLLKPDGYSGEAWSGTSMACPHVAGLAALMLQKNPTLSPAGIDSLMEQTAVDLGDPGKDNVFGSGRVDALAAVNAVPADQMPHLVQTAVVVADASADGVIDPGEDFELTFTLVNNSSLVTATGVTAGLAVAANPHVSVTDAAATFPDIPLGGGTANNGADRFSLSTAPAAPQGFEFTVYLTVQTTSGYQQTFDVDLFVGLPEWRDHDIGSVHLTVTDQGILGYLSAAQAVGNGFGPSGGGSSLFVGSLWAGTDLSYICNRDYGGDTGEWEVVTQPNGRVRDLGSGQADQTFQSIYSDSGHPSPKPLVVTQTSHAMAGAPNDGHVVLEYTARNDGATTIDDFCLGIFCDFDIGDYGANEGDTDTDRKMSYLRDAAGTSFCAITLIDDNPLKNATMINNATYVYTNGYIDDGIKVRLLNGVLSQPSTTEADDWSCLTSAGPFSLAPGSSISVTFALIYAQSLPELQDSADAAATWWANLTPISTVLLNAAARDEAVQLAWELPVQMDVVDLVIHRETTNGGHDLLRPNPPYHQAGSFLDSSGVSGTEYLYQLEVTTGWPPTESERLFSDKVFLRYPHRSAVADRTQLVRVHPNPANPGTNIAFILARPSGGQVRIVDLAGREVWSHSLAGLTAGHHTVRWNGVDRRGAGVASGVYRVVLATENNMDSRRVTLLK